MNILYKPEGPAKEYADDPIMSSDGWAANLTKGCKHGCLYCYVPDSMAWIFKAKGRKARAELFHAESVPRKDVLHKLELDLKKVSSQPEPVFFSFTTDAYQSGEDNSLTREALLLCEKYDVAVNLLTKGGQRAKRDFDIFERNKSWKFGTTLIFSGSAVQLKWEPGACSPRERYDTIREAHNRGIYTWISLEPVIIPNEALHVIMSLGHHVDFWKVGKLNHGAKISKELGDIEASIDWGQFLNDVEAIVPKEKLLIKHDLEAFRKV